MTEQTYNGALRNLIRSIYMDLEYLEEHHLVPFQPMYESAEFQRALVALDQIEHLDRYTTRGTKQWELLRDLILQLGTVPP